MTQDICSIAGCGKPKASWGYCPKHYRRAKKRGEPPEGAVHKPRGTVAERLWPKVDKNGPIPEVRPDLGSCWIWTAALDHHGYGVVYVSKEARRAPAHRIAYELTFGPVDPALDMDHLCRVPGCVNPTHLEPVTHRENMLRGKTLAAANVVKTHCPYGHPYNESNTRWKRNHTKRDCKACDRDRQQRKRDALRDAKAPSREEAIHP